MSGAAAHNALIRGIGVAHDVLRNVFFDSSTVVLLLKPSTDETREFDVVWQIEDKWFFEYQAYREAFRLEVADSSLELTNAFNDATHIQIDDDVYEIAKSDTLEPKGTDVTWKLYCTRYAVRANYAGL